MSTNPILAGIVGLPSSDGADGFGVERSLEPITFGLKGAGSLELGTGASRIRELITSLYEGGGSFGMS